MTTFWLYSAFLLIIALLFILVPVLRYRPLVKTSDSEIRKQKNIEVFQQSLGELENDREEDIITLEEFEKLKTELQRSFLSDMDDEKIRQQSATGKTNKLIPLLCLLFIPLFSYSLYEIVGSARDLELPEIMQALGEAETAEEQLAGLNRLAEILQDRFDRHEDDIQNGYMLGTLYLELENYAGAISTFSAMTPHMEDSPDKATVLGQLAQSMYMAAESQITPEIQQIINQTLAMNPNEYAVMSLLAIEAFINEDFGQALTFWRRQLIQMDPNSQQAVVLRSRIEQVESLLPEFASTPDPEQGGGTSVTLLVSLDDSVKELLDDAMTLYVFARRAEGGPPVAAVNLSVQEFPFEITLDDSLAMLPGNNLSSAENVFVGARLSRSGQAIAQPGDIEAVSEPFALSELTGPVTLNIKDIVQ